MTEANGPGDTSRTDLGSAADRTASPSEANSGVGARTVLDPDGVVERLAAVERRIASVEHSWTHAVSVTAVTKGFGPDALFAAVAAGCRRIGENYAQELISKSDALESLEPRPAVEFIGRLQSNKVRQLTELVDLWSSVDRASLVKEIAKRAPGADILVQVNSTGEENKGGCRPEEVSDLVARARDLGLIVRGLMTVGPTGEPPEAARPGFERVRGLVDEHELEICSMGMSGDLEVAVAAGSTRVRVGTALFGSRS